MHFAQSDLNGPHNLGMIKRARINAVPHSGILLVEYDTDETFVDWVGSCPLDYYNNETTISAAMITCESKRV
jgi:hypothetical protein